MHEESVFFGGVFSDDIEDGRAGADIELAHDALIATTPDGDRFAVRYDTCQIEVGGFNDRMLFCRNADRSVAIFCEDRGFPAALRYAAGGLLDEQLDQNLRAAKSRVWQGRGLGLLLLVGCVLLIVGLYVGVRIGGRAAVHAVPISVDEKIGDLGFESMDLGGPEIEDQQVVAPLQQIVDRLAPFSALPDLDFEVHVVRSDTVNAFALPGGEIVVYTGLIEAADVPEQVAGVLGHEMAHATLRHGLQRIGQSLGLAAALNLLLGDVEGIVVLGTELFQLASINSYSRAQETAADVEGVRMLHEAGIDPLGLAQFFEIMKQQGEALPDGLAWISTHPEHDVRIASVRAQVGRLDARNYEPLDIDWAGLQDRIQDP